MALGATRERIVWLVVGEGGLLVLAGVVSGGLGADAVSRNLASLLFGSTASDAATFLVAGAAVGAAAMLAYYLPRNKLRRSIRQYCSEASEDPPIPMGLLSTVNYITLLANL